MALGGRAAYVTTTEGKYVSVIDAESRNFVSKIAMPDTPLGIAACPAGRFIYVAVANVFSGSAREKARRAAGPQDGRQTHKEI